MKARTSVVAPRARGDVAAPLCSRSGHSSEPREGSQRGTAAARTREGCRERGKAPRSEASCRWAGVGRPGRRWPCRRGHRGCSAVALEHGETPLASLRSSSGPGAGRKRCSQLPRSRASAGTLALPRRGFIKRRCSAGEEAAGRGPPVRRRNAERGLPSGAGVRLQCISHKPGGGGEGRGTGPPGM